MPNTETTYFLKQVFFTSGSPNWHETYLENSDKRITALLKSALGNDFWENYAVVRLRFEREGKLLLRIKSITNNSVCFTQVWPNEALAESFRHEALNQVDMMELLRERGIKSVESTRTVTDREVVGLISALRKNPHILQVVASPWRSPDMVIGDPLKQGDLYLPFPEKKRPS